MENDSSAQATRALSQIHGFWLEMVQGPDQRVYSRYEFPGLDRMEGLGAPELPRFVLWLAVPATAQEFTLRSATSVRELIFEGQQPHPPQVAQATQPIETFLDNIRGERGPTSVRWDGRDDEGGKVASGVYLVRLIAEQRRLSSKVVMLRQPLARILGGRSSRPQSATPTRSGRRGRRNDLNSPLAFPFPSAQNRRTR